MCGTCEQLNITLGLLITQPAYCIKENIHRIIFVHNGFDNHDRAYIISCTRTERS